MRNLNFDGLKVNVNQNNIDDMMILKIVDYPRIRKGYYMVSTTGNIYNNKCKRLSPSKDKDGYLRVGLIGRPDEKFTTRIHRIVAWAFCDGYNKDTGKVIVNHKDSNRLNNDYSNLEWCTVRENVMHAVEFGDLQVSNKRKLSNLQASIACSMFEAGKNIIEVYRELSGNYNRVDNPHFYELIYSLRCRGYYKNISKKYDIKNEKGPTTIENILNEEKFLYVEVSRVEHK